MKKLFKLIIINSVLIGYAANVYPDPASQQGINIPAADIVQHEYDAHHGHSYILTSHDVFIVQTLRGKTSLQATLFSNSPVSKKEVIDRIVWVLKTTGVDKNYVARVRDRLPKITRTDKSAFDLPLIDNKGTEHHFRFHKAGENQLYILDYQRLQDTKG